MSSSKLSLIFEGIQAFSIVFLVLGLLYSHVQTQQSLNKNTVDFLQTIRTEDVVDGVLLYNLIERVQDAAAQENSASRYVEPRVEMWLKDREDFDRLKRWAYDNYAWPVSEYVWRVATCVEDGNCDRDTSRIHSCYLLQAIPGMLPHVLESSPQLAGRASVYESLRKTELCKEGPRADLRVVRRVDKLVALYREQSGRGSDTRQREPER